MEIEKTKEIIRGFFKAVNEGDAQKVLEVYYHPDIRYWIPGNSKVSGFHNLESLGSVGFELLKALISLSTSSRLLYWWKVPLLQLLLLVKLNSLMELTMITNITIF